MKIKALFILLAVVTCVGCGSQSTDANYTNQQDTEPYQKKKPGQHKLMRISL